MVNKNTQAKMKSVREENPRELMMLPINPFKHYKVPPEYQRDGHVALMDDREFPNINSQDYAKRPFNRQLLQHQAWEAVARNENGLVTIATNKMKGRQFSNSIWGYDQVDDFSPEKAVFKTQRKFLITNMEHSTSDKLFISYSSGGLDLASLDFKLPNKNEENENGELSNPNLSMILTTNANIIAHDHPIVSLEVMKANKDKCITGDKNGGLKVFAVSENSWSNINSWEYAHLHTIKGITSSANEESLFATCSLDKSVLLWDLREVRPALALYEFHKVRFTSLFWPSFNNNHHTLYVGDESGYLHSIDTRQPKKLETIKKISEKPIHKLIPNEFLTAVISNSNIFKVVDLRDHSIVFVNGDAKHFLRDGVWLNDKEFLVTSYEGKAYRHKISI